MDISAFRQMVEKNPKGFLGRYGLGNKILQEGGSVEEAAEHPVRSDACGVAPRPRAGTGVTRQEGRGQTCLEGRDRRSRLRAIQRRCGSGAGTATTLEDARVRRLEDV